MNRINGIDSRRTRVVKLQGLPEIVRHNHGSSRVIDANIKPQAPTPAPAPRAAPVPPLSRASLQRSSLSSRPMPASYPTTHKIRRKTPLLTTTPEPTISPDKCYKIMEGVERLGNQLQLISQQLESVLKIVAEQKINSYPSNGSPTKYVEETLESPAQDEVLADISMASREYLSRHHLLDTEKLSPQTAHPYVRNWSKESWRYRLH